MPVGDIVKQTFDNSSGQPVLVEKHVIKAESTTSRTISVQDGNSVEKSTYDVTRDVRGENRDAILAKIRQAMAANATYIGLATPSAAQTTAQVQRLSREVNGILKLLLDDLDDTNNT